MSNKVQINELDRLIRKTVQGGMEGGVLVRIEFIWGFELFNTRPYHNYETWSGGYRVTGRGQTGTAEDLDDALKLWAEKVEKTVDPDRESWEGRRYMGTVA